VYVLTVAPGGLGVIGFGVVDASGGGFAPIGPGFQPDQPGAGTGLAPGRGASLLTLNLNGNLDAINVAKGAASTIGATGLRDCSAIGSFDPLCANVIGNLDGTVYVTDFAQNLYSVDQKTGKARLIGPTQIPPLTFAPASENPDGSVNLYAESLFGAGGKLYALFSAVAINFDTGAATQLSPGAIYQIDPETGGTRRVATDPSLSNISTIVNVNDTIYGFDTVTGQVVTVDLGTGETTPVSDLDRAAGIIVGATPVRPASGDRD
jgi:outer membrane protein assembly factor BamB